MIFSQIPMAALIILPLLVATPVLASLIKNRKWQIGLISLLTIFIVTELVSIYFSGGFIDYQFFVNLNLRDIIAGLFIFKLQAALAIICFLLIVIVLALLTRLIQKYFPVWLRLGLLVIVAVLISQNEGPISKLHEIYQVTTAQNSVFEQSLEQLGMHDYITKSALDADKGKNIIVISLESFERGFMDMQGIAPNLSNLSKRYTYFPAMPMGVGSSWTTASMYTYMTGIPFLVGELSTSPLNSAETTQLVNLGDVLHRAGYQTRYVMGSPNFAGMGHIISMFNIPVVSESDYPNKYPDAPFGLYDHDIFDVAKLELTKLRDQKQPFALFISTISTHAPNGFEDERMREFVSPQADNMAFVAASLDYNLGAFIHYLEDSNQLDDTVFYIFPDHLMMGSGTATITRLSLKPRSLYLISSAEPLDLGKDKASTIYQIDLPRLILNGAQIRTNAKFLTDYMTNDVDKFDYIKTHKGEIAQLNRAAQISHNEAK